MVLQLISKGRDYILKEQASTLGLLKFPKWYSQNAIIELDKRQIEIKKNSMWSNSFQILERNAPIGCIKSNWKGILIIELKDQNRRLKTFRFKSKGVFKMNFQLFDERQKHLLTFHQTRSWKKMKSDYQIELIEPLQELDLKLLSLSTTFCIILFESQIATAGATGAVG